MKLAFTLLGFIVAFGLGIITMVNGYGLTIQSWPWLIFGSIGSAFFGMTILLVGDK